MAGNSSMTEGDSWQITVSQEKMFNFSESDFALIVRTASFVDKTLMIKDIFSNSSKLLITAPPKFGKSTIVSMVKRFLEIEVYENGMRKKNNWYGSWITDNLGLFRNNELEISKEEYFCKEHFGSYPVIYIDCLPLSEMTNIASMINSFRTIIMETFSQHIYLLISRNSQCWRHGLDKRYFENFVSDKLIKNINPLDLMQSFKHLSKLLCKHFSKRVFVLIDNCDAFVNSTLFMSNNSDTLEMMSFVKTTMDNLLKKNQYVERALLTGVLPVTGKGFPFHGNNIDCYYFMGSHPFSKYYGLTSNELDYVLTKLVSDSEQRIKAKSKIDKYYNKFNIERNQSVQVYNILSVLQYLYRKEAMSYSCDWKYISAFNPVLGTQRVKDKLHLLLSGCGLQLNLFEPLSATDILQLTDTRTGKVPVPSQEDIFFILLYHFGFLSISKYLDFGRVEVIIPNKEIESEVWKMHNFKTTIDLDEFCDQLKEQI